jgi:phosphoribosylpyrophosphate synthetase
LRCQLWLNEKKVQGIKAEIAFGHKSREKDNEVAKIIIIGDVEGRNCLLIDDIMKIIRLVKIHLINHF